MENENPASAVAHMRAYIAENLHRPITLSGLTKATGYSRYHAARLFKEETGLSPFEYIRRERLVKSARVLRGGNVKVLDVALDFVFDSHEGFTRAFVNAFGITPKKYAKHPDSDGWQVLCRYLDRQKHKAARPLCSSCFTQNGNLFGVKNCVYENEKLEEMIMETKTAVIFTQIMERPARKLIMKRSKKATHYHEYCEEYGCEETQPWNTLCAIKEALYEPVGVWLPGNMRPEGTGIYAHAVEVPASYAGEVPEGFDIVCLEPCKFIVFQGEPYDDEFYGEAVGACMERIEKFNPEVYGYEYANELAPKMQLAPAGWRGYIELRPVRPVSEVTR